MRRIKKKRLTKSERFWKEIEEQIALMRRITKTSFSKHRYRPGSHSSSLNKELPLYKSK
jgi:hypothetical protein